MPRRLLQSIHRFFILAYLGAAGCDDPPPDPPPRTWVRSVPADTLVVSDANLFDLAHRTVRFTPLGDQYDVAVIPSTFDHREGTFISKTGQLMVRLPFAFPFGGSAWSAVYVEPWSGTVRFVSPPDPNGVTFSDFSRALAVDTTALWPSGSMDLAAASLIERVPNLGGGIIAALWGPYDTSDSDAGVLVESDRVSITWRAARPSGGAPWDELGPGGQNVFQATLHASGVVDLSFEAISDVDGIVGLFPAKVKLDRATPVHLAAGGAFAPPVYEVFRYPSIKRTASEILPGLHASFGTKDDLVLLLTDFRFDTIFGATPSTGPIPGGIRGIGLQGNYPDLIPTGIQVSLYHPFWVGQPGAAEFPVIKSRPLPYRRYAAVVGLFAHELIHRWGVALHMHDPGSDKVISLSDSYLCACHWSSWLHSPALYPVADRYAPGGYETNSIMGGSVWDEISPGVFSARDVPYAVPTGLSALDLYAMGFLEVDEVPDTFMLSNPVQREDGTIKADKVPVRIGGIVTAMEARVPTAASSQRTFSMGVYLLYRGAEPNADALRRAEDIAEELAWFFNAATGGKMRVVPTASP